MGKGASDGGAVSTLCIFLIIAFSYFFAAGPAYYCDTGRVTVLLITLYCGLNLLFNWGYFLYYSDRRQKPALRLRTVPGGDWSAQGHSGDSLLQVANGQGAVGPFCGKCRIDKEIPRAHHCPLCGVCVLKHDHHCYVLGACIGFHNERYFIVFLLHTTVATFFMCFIQHHFLDQHVPDAPSNPFWYFLPGATLGVLLRILSLRAFYHVMVFNLCFSACGASAGFFGYTLYNAATGYVSYERSRQVRTYGNRRVARNLRSVFGRQWGWGWVAPWLGSENEGDGVTWSKAEEVDEEGKGRTRGLVDYV